MRSLLRIRLAILEIWIQVSFDHSFFPYSNFYNLKNCGSFLNSFWKSDLIKIFKCVTGILVVVFKNDHSSITHFTCKQMVIVHVFIMSRLRKHQSQLILTVQLFSSSSSNTVDSKIRKFWVLINFSFEIFVPVTMFVNRTQSL